MTQLTVEMLSESISTLLKKKYTDRKVKRTRTK